MINLEKFTESDYNNVLKSSLGAQFGSSIPLDKVPEVIKSMSSYPFRVKCLEYFTSQLKLPVTIMGATFKDAKYDEPSGSIFLRVKFNSKTEIIRISNLFQNVIRPYEFKEIEYRYIPQKDKNPQGYNFSGDLKKILEIIKKYQGKSQPEVRYKYPEDEVNKTKSSFSVDEIIAKIVENKEAVGNYMNLCFSSHELYENEVFGGNHAPGDVDDMHESHYKNYYVTAFFDYIENKYGATYSPEEKVKIFSATSEETNGSPMYGITGAEVLQIANKTFKYNDEYNDEDE